MSRNSSTGSKWGWCPRFGDLDHLPQTAGWGCCTVPRAPTLGSLLHPHPPLWGVHAFPAFLECCLSTPSSTKETLTAINYHTGWTKGIPLCWNIGAHRHTHTHAHMCSSALYVHTQKQRRTTWPPLVFIIFDKWVEMFCPLASSNHHPAWLSVSSGRGRAGRGGVVMTRQPVQDVRATWNTHTHTMLVESCLCVCCTRFYETTLWWSAQILTFDEKHAEDSSSLSGLSSKSVFSYTLYSAEACLLCVCMRINLQYWLEIGHSLLIQARTEPLTVSAASGQSSCQHIEPNVVFM